MRWGTCGEIRKHGQYVLVRKLTSQSTDPVALFGVNVHSRGVDVFDAGVLLRCRDVKQEKWPRLLPLPTHHISDSAFFFHCFLHDNEGESDHN